MELIVMVLVTFPLGFFVRNRTAAFLAYTAIHSFVFTVQTLSLVLEWASGSAQAFGRPFPAYERSEVLAYAVVNLVIYLVGLGLVYLGGRIGARRRARVAGGVSLDPAAR